MMRIIAITGGIGSGKSVVSAILRKLGYDVYDCDSNAKRLMAESHEIKVEIAAAFGVDVINAEGVIDSRRLAGIVFADATALSRLNGIVHPRVKADIEAWAMSRNRPTVFVETAILRESNLHTIVDDEWCVKAPEQVRVARVMLRSGLSEPEVRARIASQGNSAQEGGAVIVNDGIEPILPQIVALLATL